MNSRARTVAISTVGYMSLAIAGWMLSMSAARWYTDTLGVSFLAALAIVLTVMGILAFVGEHGLDSVVFFGGAAVLGTTFTYAGAAATAHIAQPLSYMGWFACMWAIYFGCTWIGSIRSGVTRSAFLGFLTLTLIALAIGGWSGVGGWMVAGGYLGLISSVLAFATAGLEIIRHGMIVNPNVEVTGTGTGAARPIAAD